MQDSELYLKKKKHLSRLLTIYGRKPVLEALQNSELEVVKLHLADSNKTQGIIEDIQRAANNRQVEVMFHSKQALSRISKNAKQDQGVALDITCPKFIDFEDFIAAPPTQFELIALDRVTNPQNVGMIIRSVAASPLTGLLLPEKGSATLDALVIKASSGNIFKAPLIRCKSLPQALTSLAEKGSAIIGLDLQASATIGDFQAGNKCVFVLGNETTGLSPEVKGLCTDSMIIPLANGVESLNVSVTASLIAFRKYLSH